jgi:hypothetical protein
VLVSTDPRRTEPPLRDEEDALRQTLREELERDHAERLEKLEKRKDRARARTHERRDEQRAEIERKLKDEVRDQFYEEKGYVEYVDASGRREWVPKEEYEWRMRRRKKSRKPDLPMSNRMREVVVMGLGLVVAVIIGIVFVLKQ